MEFIKRNRLPSLASLMCVLAATSAIADDTEIYVTRDLPADQKVRPNILFVVDTSGSMQSGVPGTNCYSLNYNNTNTLPRNWCTSTYKWTNGATKTRIQVVKEVINNLVSELAGSNDVNIGLARFDSNSNGGFINVPIGRAADNAPTINSELSSYYAGGATPLLETYYEAARYMRGEGLVWGSRSMGYREYYNGYQLQNPWASSSNSRNGNTYISPIQYSCQKSNIILITDGLPNGDSDNNQTIQNLVSKTNTVYKSCKNYPTDGEPYAGCWAPGLAEYLANQDNNPNLPGSQRINTYTIGFGNISDTSLLQDTANLGGGRFFTTTNTSELSSALKSIAVDILAENTTFSTPSVAVSAYNNLGYRNDLYYALFRPAEDARWFGNIKKYKQGRDSSGNTAVLDRNGSLAIDNTTGFFSNTSMSYWSGVVDGRDVKLGGAAGQLSNPSSRKVLTYTGADKAPGETTSVNLNTSTHLLNTNNSAITNAMLGLSSSATADNRANVIKWGRGLNPADGTVRLALGDILHNEPKLIAYVTDEDLVRVANSQATPPTATSTEKLVLFYGTNEGFINAVDPATGNEIFSFIPKELLPNLNTYYTAPKGTSQKKYGMDGQFDLYAEYGSLSANNTRTLSKATLYAGMRRGGKNYYALDVTPTSISGTVSIDPKLKWVIKGGTTAGFEKLGQTWSTPKVSKVKFNNQNRQVLIFTGGYDTRQDIESPNTPTDDAIGNALYIVDADTGALLWHAGSTNEASANLKIGSMTNSIPADPTLVDINNDGNVDYIFLADTRGQIFRVDINQGNSGAADFAKGGRIANFGGTTAADNRRFYNSPDVALIRERGGKTYFTIAIGSGYREHPLNEDTADRFYVLRDSNVYSSPDTYTTLTESNLVDVTSVNLTSAQAQEIQGKIDSKLNEINILNQKTILAENNFSSYKSTVGYIEKLNFLTQANSDANSRQAQIDALYATDPYLDDHAAESSSQSALQGKILDLQQALTKLNSYDSELAKQLGQQLSGLLLVQSSLDTASANVTSKEQAVIDAKAKGASGDTILRLEEDLSAARSNYENMAWYGKRSSLNQQDITTILRSLSNSVDAKDNNAIQSSLSELAQSLNLTAVPSKENSEVLTLLARDEQGKATTLVNIAQNQQGLVTLAKKLESERLTLAGQASSLQSDLAALTNREYDNSSNLLSAEDLATATAQDAAAPLTMFEAYEFLISKARNAALNQIPALRSDINNLYSQLTPGNTYTPNMTLLNSSSGWFVRFPQGEKVLAASTSFDGSVLFTTFSPNGQTVTTCGPDIGKGRFYAMNLTDATAVFTTTVNGSEIPTRSFDLVRGGIPPTPSIILDDKGAGILVGSESAGPKTPPTGSEGQVKCSLSSSGFCKSNNAVSGTYWREN